MTAAVSAWRILPDPNVRPETLLRLNLGCGLRYQPGFVNIDSNPDLKPDLVLDLGADPLPYEDNSVREVNGFDILEHMRSPSALFHVVNECHRVLAPSGYAIFETPNALSKAHPDWAFGDPTHQRFFVPHTWDYFTKDHEQYEHNGRLYGIKPWRVSSLVMLNEDGTIRITLQPVKE